MSDAARAVAPAQMPRPMGVLAESGKSRAALSENDLHHISPDPAVVLARSQRGPVLAVDSSVDDSNDLTQTGWRILFASDADPGIKARLRPLIELRKSQVNNERLFREFEGQAGVRPQQSASSWASNKGVSLSAPVNPKKGVPYYLLIVGSPQRIPFRFQAEFDLQWAAGRLHFDNIDDYAAYAERVVAHETGKTQPRAKRAALWMPRNRMDLATAMLAGGVGGDFLGELSPEDGPLGHRQGFQLTSFIGAGEATKPKLTDIWRGNIEGGPPAIVFTGSHGAEWEATDLEVQKARQGALVCQEWMEGQPLKADHYFAGADLPGNANLDGLLAFIFACYGGACPDKDSYFFNQDGTPIPVTPEPFVANLPQALLRKGAQAVVAHIDRAFSYAFEDAMGTPQAQLLRTPLEQMMKGQRVGLACDSLNLQWSSLAALLGLAQGGNLPGATMPKTELIANLFVARDDARNYCVFGDPAVRLDVQRLA